MRADTRKLEVKRAPGYQVPEMIVSFEIHALDERRLRALVLAVCSPDASRSAGCFPPPLPSDSARQMTRYPTAESQRASHSRKRSDLRLRTKQSHEPLEECQYR